MKTACKNGNCEKLFDKLVECDCHKDGKHICRFMNQTDGRCLHRIASKPKSRNAKQQNGFRKMSNASWAEMIGANK